MPLNNFTGASNTPSSQPPSQNQNNELDDLLTNYNEKYKNEKPIKFRDNEIKQTIATLIEKFKANAVLIGPAGSGKTKIVEDIARMLENDDPMIPNSIKNHKIYELPISNIVSGSSFVGDIEKKIKSVIDFCKDKSNKAILFIDEIHQLTEEGNTQYNKIAQILKPYLARGEIKTIGATTTQESKTLLSDPAFNRRFSKIIVSEFSKEQTNEILENILPSLNIHYNHQVNMNYDLIPVVTQMADKYKTQGSNRPDNAITLLDKIFAEKIVLRCQKLKDAANDPTLLQIIKSQNEIVKEKDIENIAISQLRGKDVQNSIDFDVLSNEIKSNVLAQDNIIDDVIKKLKQNSLGLFETNKPLSFLWAGKSGTGKTQLTKELSKALTDMPPIILNMTEYHSPASINRLIGAPAGYIGSDSKAELPFDILETNPYRVILLDEFEKADKSVQRLFMQALDEGYIMTNKNTIINFSKTIIIATTNAGQTASISKMGFSNNNTQSMTDQINSLKKHFDIELLNRFQGNISTFNSISKEEYENIIVITYDKLYNKILNEKPRLAAKLSPTLSDDELKTLTDNYVPELNARPITNLVKQFIEDKLL